MLGLGPVLWPWASTLPTQLKSADNDPQHTLASQTLCGAHQRPLPSPAPSTISLSPGSCSFLNIPRCSSLSLSTTGKLLNPHTCSLSPYRQLFTPSQLAHLPVGLRPPTHLSNKEGSRCLH